MKYRLITFDVYTALVDLDHSLVPPLARLAGPAGAALDMPAVLRVWRAKQLEYALISTALQKGHVAFADVTRRALDYALRRFQLDLPETARLELVEAWNRLTLWPDVQAAWREVKSRGYPLAVLSNGDEAMLRALLAFAGLEADDIFAADQAGVYKPHPAIYGLPLGRLGLAPGEVLHVAGSATDTLGAKAAGLACAWVNRAGDAVLDPAYAPDYEFRRLTELAAIL